MIEAGAVYRLEILGPFRLLAPDGSRVDVPSKRGQALLALLATAGGGERTRSWLQDHLWGARMPEQGKASLRRELSNLRAVINRGEIAPLRSDHSSVWLDLTQIAVDARLINDADSDHGGELLEGLDIAGEDLFEDWLREERARLRERTHRTSLGRLADQQSRAHPIVAVVSESFGTLPALAVLPFATQTGDTEHDPIANGLAEDLIDRLSRLRWLPVIASSSSFAVQNPSGDLRAAGSALGARYITEGRLRSADNALQLSLSLIDVADGTLVWSSQIALPLPLAADRVEDLMLGLATALGVRIDHQEQARAASRPQSDLNVRDLIWRGKWHLNQMTRQDAALARDCFAKALEQEPNSPEALIQVAWARMWDLWVARGDIEQTRAARKLAQRAILASSEDARGHMLAGIAEIWLRQPLRAEALLTRAIELNPSLVMARVQLGSIHYLRGDPASAVAMFNLAIKLSPNDQYMFFTYGEMAQACFMLGDLDGALDYADRSLMRRSAYWMPYVIKINALKQLGRVAEARAALAELLASKSGFSPEFIDWTPFMDPDWNRKLKAGLNRIAAATD